VEEESLLESWNTQLTNMQTTGASHSICVLFSLFFLDYFLSDLFNQGGSGYQAADRAGRRTRAEK